MRQAVLATLAYYDILDFPLKAEEVFNCLIKVNGDDSDKPTPIDIRCALDQLVLEKIISAANGYYFLSDREYLVPLRLKKEKISRRKMVRARRAVRWLAFVPYVEAVFASGSLGLGNCDELSDLDVLVITKHGRIWTARLLITGFLSVFGLRRKPRQKIAPDKICLNHYITDASLTIPFHSIYNAQTYLNLKPLLVCDPGLFAEFQKKNPWIGDFLYHPWQVGYDPAITIRLSRFARAVSAILKIFFPAWLEGRVKRYQIRRITHNPLTSHPVGHVVYDDEQLAFHPDSPEPVILEKYQAKLNELTGA